MKKIFIILLSILLVGVGIIILFLYIFKDKNNIIKHESDMDIVLSLEDKISDNTAWCGTFNLIWNDLKNDLVKQDIVFTPQMSIVENLNKGTFDISNISEDSYYKIYGVPSSELKDKIEKDIKLKFNETSDILDSFDFENTTDEDYFLYSMLKKDFEFPMVFTRLENGKFGEYTNVKYFGINDSTKSAVRAQVKVLYYNSTNDFAIKLITKSNDEVIISRGNKGDSLYDVYSQIDESFQKYTGSNEITNGEKVEIPEINLNIMAELKDIEQKPFLFADGRQYVISKALQTIKFSLDEKGGRIKSEAGMMVNKVTAMEKVEEKRNFIVDDTFFIFLKEQGKKLPYFAAKISDISKVQSSIIKF